MSVRILAGPGPQHGAENLADHLKRLGPLPAPRPDALFDELDASGLLGRGGAGFPVGRKWRSVAERSNGDITILANGAEGEPLSAKDRTLMAARPHLVLDGALLAAEAVAAQEVVLYVGESHSAARMAMAHAVQERASRLSVPVRLLPAPDAYVSGEETAAVHFVNESDARPTTTPPRPFERGINGRPTLIQNVESLANVALIARNGADWYREAGLGQARGTALVTVTGSPTRGVTEIDLGLPLGELAGRMGLRRADVDAVLVGGYFGGWVSAGAAWEMPLDPTGMRTTWGRGFGCGVVSFLAPDSCGVKATARIMNYMATQSAAQCGPCTYGLRAIADAVGRLAKGRPERTDLERVQRWSADLAGRGACRHPDGAIGLLGTAMDVFGDEFRRHLAGRTCTARDGLERAA
jgi:NADH:ubiquinone oxidoreductase subunit F (NADH-binding)